MKIKKLIPSFFAVALIACIGLCGCSQQSTNEQDSTTEQEPTTEQDTPSYTDHTHQGNTVCSVCGLDYFEEAVDLIKENGKYYPDNTIAYLYQGKTTVNGDTFLSGVGYSPEDDSISILAYETSSLYTYAISITIPSSSQGTSMQEQEYDWFFCELDSGSIIVLGTLDATTYVSYNTTLTPTAYTGVTNSYTLSLACSLASRLCNIGLSDAFAPLLELSDKNLSPSNFGFIYF